MKKSKIPMLTLLGALTFGGLTVATLTGCDDVSETQATLTLSYDSSQGSAYATTSDGTIIDDSTSLEEGDAIVIKITPNDGYKVFSVNGTQSSATEWNYTLVAGENVITIVFEQDGSTSTEDPDIGNDDDDDDDDNNEDVGSGDVGGGSDEGGDTVIEEEGLGFELKSSIITINLENQASGVALSNYITWDEGVTESALMLDPYETDYYSFDGTTITPLKAGVTMGVKVYKYAEGLGEDNYATVTIAVTSNMTDLDNFNVAGTFADKDKLLNYFDTSDSNRISEMPIESYTDATSGYALKLWVANGITSEDDLPALNLKATLTSGLEANTEYTITLDLYYGVFNNIYISVDGTTLTPTAGSYGGSYRTYYHTFTTGDDISNGVEIELNISYEGDMYEEDGGVGPWGFVSNYQILKGYQVPAETVRTNYIRDGGFDYKDECTGVGDAETWTLSGGDNSDYAWSYYNGWATVDGTSLYFDTGDDTAEYSYTQEFTVNETTTYDFEYSFVLGTDYGDDYIDYLYILITNSSNEEIVKIDKSSATSSASVQTSTISLAANETYTIGIYGNASDNVANGWAHAAFDSFGIYKSSGTDTQITIDGLHHVQQGDSITLKSNYSEDVTWSTSSNDVTIESNGNTCTVTGVNVTSEDVTITATYGDNTSTATHTISVRSEACGATDDVIEDDTYTIDESVYIQDGSFEQSGAAGGLISTYWTRSGATPSSTTWYTNENVSEGSYAYNVWFETAPGEDFVLAQTNNFTVSEAGTYELSYSLMASGVSVTAGIYDSEGTEIGTTSGYSGWTSTVSDRYTTLEVELSANTSYTFKFTFNNIQADAWLTLDDVSLEKVITPVQITCEATTAQPGEEVTLYANKNVTWGIEGNGTISSSTTTSATIKVNDDANSEDKIIVTATSTATGEETNIDTYTITVYKLEDPWSIDVDKTEVYDTHSVTFTTNKDVTYTIDSLTERTDYTVSGNTITFTLGLTDYGVTQYVTVKASYGDESVEKTITVYSTTLTNNGTFDHNSTDETWDPTDYGWKNYATDTNYYFWLNGEGAARVEYTNPSSSDVEVSLGLYWEFTLIEDSITLNYTAHYTDTSFSGWGSVKFFDSTLETQIGSTIWASYDSEATGQQTLSEGTYNYGYFVQNTDGSCTFTGSSYMWIGIYTLTLTVA